MSVPDNQRGARARVPKTALVGFVAGSLALLLAACGGSPQAGVASLGNAKTTTTAQSARAGAGGGGGGGGANAGNGAPGGGAHAVMVMSGGNGADKADKLKYAQCMRSHGVVDFPDPSSNGTILVGGTVSQSPQYSAADETCHELLPNGGIPTTAQRAQGIAQLLKFSVCMRAHGIRDYPDPTSNGIRIPVPNNPGSDLYPDNPRAPVRRQGLPAPHAAWVSARSLSAIRRATRRAHSNERYRPRSFTVPPWPCSSAMGPSVVDRSANIVG
jgi:hypothetical protein